MAAAASSPVTVFFAACAVGSIVCIALQQNEGGRFGARGPDYFQVDIRAGWRRRIQDRTLELFVDVFNLTNRTNWDNPLVANSDERLPNTFLTLTNLRGGSGFPRSVQFGTRIAF